MPKNPKPPRIAARLSKGLKKRLDDATKTSGMKDSELVRCALIEFFDRNRTPDQIIAAVVEARKARTA